MSNYPTSTITIGNDTFELKDHRNAGVYYGTSSTAAGTQTKVVTCAKFALATGAIIFVKFSSGQSYNGAAKLNVNSTGAKTVTQMGTSGSKQYCWCAGEIVGFVYDGTNYVMLEGANATTTYYGVTKLSSATNSTSELLAATPAAVKAAYDLAAAADNKIPTPTTADAGKSLVVTALGKYILSDGSNHTVTLDFDEDYSPTAIYVEAPNGTRYHGDSEEPGSFTILDGDTIHCYVDYSEMDNIITLNGNAVAGMYGGPAEYDLKVTGNVSITVSGSPGSYGRIAITMLGASKTVTLYNTSSYTQNCFVEYGNNQYYTQGDTISIPVGGTLRCYANCGYYNYIYVNGTEVSGGAGAKDFNYTVTSDITVTFDISIGSYGAVRITTT